jgi:radical SAM protein with 4Fe4S-binding SPASM domain
MTAFVDDDYADHIGLPRDERLTRGLFSAPLDVHLAVTGRCNLGCAGCYARGDDGERDMSLDLAKRILDHLASWGVFTVALGGGEPLTHPDVFAIAAHARKRGLVPNMTTNGVLLDVGLAAECSVFGNVHLSCHCTSELPRLAESVRALRGAGVTPGLNVLVSAGTFGQLDEIWAWARRQGIGQVLALKFKLTAQNRDRADLLLSVEQERAMLPAIGRLSRRYGVMPMLDCSLFPALAAGRPRRHTLEFFDVNGCLGGNAYLAVDVDGRYKPCSFWDKPFGDVLALERGEWVGNRKLRSFRESRIAPECGGCEYLELCNGGCRVCAVETAACRD